MFGTHEQFMAFTTELKARNMHLIVDGVFNHVGDDSIYFDRYNKYPTIGAYEYWSRVYDLMNTTSATQSAAETAVSTALTSEGQTFSPEKYHLWFNIKNVKVDQGLSTERYDYQAWWGFDSLPEFKSITGTEAIALGLATVENVAYASEYNNQYLVDYIFKNSDSAAKSWLQNGAAGWRLDVANEVDPKFWVEFRKDLKNPDFITEIGYEPLILGEIWDDASKYFVGDQYDSVMNYRFERALLGFLKNGNASSTNNALIAVKEDYPMEAYYAMMNLIGSHDTARAVYLLGGASGNGEVAIDGNDSYNHALGVSRLKLAAIFQMGYVGAPTIYYGDEVGMTGSKDPDTRRTYPWGNEDQDLLSHYRAVGAVRTTHKNLFAYGDLQTLYASGDVYIYARKYQDSYAIVGVNRGSSEQTLNLNMKGSLINNIQLTDALDSSYQVTTANNSVTITIPSMSGRMLVTNPNQPLALPQGITNLAAAEGSQQVTLSWTASPDVVEYNVYQSTIKGALYTKISTITDITTSVSGLTNGRKYHFAIGAVDLNGNESDLVEISDVIPHYNLATITKWIGNLTTLTSGEIDLSQVKTVSAELFLENITTNGYAEGLKSELLVKHENDSDFTHYEGVYVGQAGNNNLFTASFVPLEAGTYTYKMQFTSNLGREWIATEPKTVIYTKNTVDITLPMTDLVLAQPQQESGQVNLNWQGKLDATDGPVLFRILRNGVVYTDLWNHPVDVISGDGHSTYRDYDVVNGETYTYLVRAYDRLGNHIDSNTVTVTPNLVMVDVTFKVKAPAYTPLSTKITMPGNLNGWNTGAWEMSRNGAVTPDWQYTVQIQDGEEISYKYVKESSWDQEALTIHNIINPDPEDISYYGVGNEGTNMRVVVENQGGNKMTIEDTILRWIDQPVVITSPENPVTLSTDNVTITGNAIRGGVLTIQGAKDTTPQVVTINHDMTFSQTVALNTGANTITLSIRPSDESIATKFNGDSGAIGKNTKTYTITVNTTGGTTTPTNPPSTGTPTTNPTNPAGHIKGLDQAQVDKLLEKGNIKAAQAVAAALSKQVTMKNGKVTDTKTLEKALSDVLEGFAAVEKQLKGGMDNAGLANVKKNLAVTLKVEKASKSEQIIVPIPASFIAKLQEKGICIKIESDNLTMTLDPKAISKDLLTSATEVTIKKSILSQEDSKDKDKATKTKNPELKPLSATYSFEVSVTDKEGKETLVSKFDSKVQVALVLDTATLASIKDKRKVAIYYVGEDGTVEYKGRKFTDTGIVFETEHFSDYILMESIKTFDDIKNHWATDYIEVLGSRQIAQGSGKDFNPNRQITRGEFATLLGRAFDMTSVIGEGFKDLSANHYSAKYVKALAAQGIITGYEDGTFRSEATISREEMITMIMKAYAIVSEEGMSSLSITQEQIKEYTDFATASTYARANLEAALSLGLIHGDGHRLINPRGKATRAEVAKILVELLEKTNSF
jgi:glycosidase